MNRYRIEVRFHGLDDVHQSLESWSTRAAAERVLRTIVESASKKDGSVREIATIEVVPA